MVHGSHSSLAGSPTWPPVLSPAPPGAERPRRRTMQRAGTRLNRLPRIPISKGSSAGTSAPTLGVQSQRSRAPEKFVANGAPTAGQGAVNRRLVPRNCDLPGGLHYDVHGIGCLITDRDGTLVDVDLGPKPPVTEPELSAAWRSWPAKASWWSRQRRMAFGTRRHRRGDCTEIGAQARSVDRPPDRYGCYPPADTRRSEWVV